MGLDSPIVGISLRLRRVQRLANEWLLPTPRQMDDGGYELNASEVQEWVNAARYNDVSNDLFFVGCIMEEHASQYIYTKCTEAPTSQPDRIKFLRSATREYRLNFW